MCIKIRTLTVIATIALAIVTSSAAFPKERGYTKNNGPNVIIRGHDRIMYPPQTYYQQAHARQFNDRQYLRMQKHRKMKRKIRRMRRLYNAHNIERPIIIVTAPHF